MAKKSGRNTKSKIVSAAWKLFYDQGYDATTVKEIIFQIGHVERLVLSSLLFRR